MGVPGGKVEPDETPQQALVRELQEELSVRIGVGPELGRWAINDALDLHLYFAEITEGDPTPGEDHDEVRWLLADELDTVDWLPTDAAALPALRDAIV